MGDSNKLCEGLTNSNYVCVDKINRNYTVNTNLTQIIDLKSNESININEEKTEISLTPFTSNHYFIADEKAHCSEKWQDWFCVPNYHNNNKINKFPITDTMSVGVCFNSCPAGYIPSKINKCSVYNVEDDLLYNPLAIIAIFGTNLHMNIGDGVIIENYNNIKDTIGIRGSYLNDLYRVNYNNRFIPKDRIDYIIDNSNIINIEKQEKLIINIIKKLINKGNLGGELCSTIKSIKDDIKNTTIEFNKTYVKQLQNSKVKQNRLLGKIKDYILNIDKLDKLYGLDKSGKSKLKNVISYVYNIMLSVFYKKIGNDYVINKNIDIDNNIRDLFEFNNINLEDQNSLIKIFKFACYNCFNVNYDIIKEYLDDKFGEDDEDIIRRDKKVEYKYPNDFIKCDIDVEQLESVSSNKLEYNIPYYNNIVCYEHQLLSEYSESTQSIIQIVLILAIFLGIIVVIWFIYMAILYFPFFNKGKGDFISAIVSFLNYCYLFYSMITYYFVCTISYLYYYILCKYCNSNYTILNIFLKLVNIVIIIALVICSFLIILEMLNINYIKLLQNMDFGIGNQVLEGSDIETNSFIYIYLAALYFIGIYMYSIYITRYSISSKEFEMITNMDAKDANSTNYINNLLLNKYIDNMLSKFNAVYNGNAKDIVDNGDGGGVAGGSETGGTSGKISPTPPPSPPTPPPTPPHTPSLTPPTPSLTPPTPSLTPDAIISSMVSDTGRRGVMKPIPSGALSMPLADPFY